MIYIFDDKKIRQEGYRWSSEKFKAYAEFVTPVYRYSEVKEDTERKKIFSQGNVILFHESFFDADFNRHHKEAIEIRRELEEFAQTHSNFYLAFFSGSKSSRLLNINVAYLPVSILYQNLEEFVQKFKKGKLDLKYLLYGDNSNIEQDLVEKLNISNASLLNLRGPFNIPNGTNILIATTVTNDRLPRIVTGADYKMSLNGDSDIDIHNAIKTHLQATQYDKIFIPLCFGSSMSDFNGLRLAAHIRCTDTINRCIPICLYSFVKIDELINNEYFNILKTKNVQLIDYTIKAFEDFINLVPELFELTELPWEMAKLKLEVPNDFEDSHSMANEWAIYKWAKAINSDDNTIHKITEKVNTQLYFKNLSTIYPITEIPNISEGELQLNKPGKPKILYVDDDSEKGWYEILCKILSDINFIEELYYLGDELKKVSQEEIIDKTICNISENAVDIVILDFRLHPNDFIETSIKNVTGFKLLQNIKKINPGIQVIIFSATAKIWNLQALLEAGADGFIIKESPVNGMNPSFTKDSIMSFMSSIETAIRKCFLKDFFITCTTISRQLHNCDTEPGTNFDDFIKDLKSHIKLIKHSASKIDLKTSMTLDVVFLNCYNFMEKFKQHYLRESDYQQVLGIDEIEMKRYFWLNGKVINQGKFIRNGVNDSPSWFNTMAGLFIDYFQLANIHDNPVVKLNIIKDERNNYIHGSKNKFHQNELLMAISLCEMITSNLRE